MTISEAVKKKNSRIFTEPGVAEVIDGYADNVKYCRELRICLLVHDWNKFVRQPFFQELVEYLDRIQIQGNINNLDPDKEK